MKKCYNCGKLADSKDHLPPKGFFPKPSPSNLITAPCCGSCNNSFSPIDEKFRAFVASDENRNSAGLRILSEKVFSRNSIKGRPFLEIAMSMRPVVVWKSPRHTVVPKLSMPKQEVEAFLFRLTRGLVFKFYRTIHNLDAHLYFEYLSDPNEPNPALVMAKQMAPAMDFTDIGDGVFAFWRAAQGRSSIWIYCFYQGATFFVLHSMDDHPLFHV